MEDRKCLQLAEEDARAVAATALTAYGHPLATVPSFKYLGNILSSLDDYWLEEVHNLGKAQKKWVGLSQVLSR